MKDKKTVSSPACFMDFVKAMTAGFMEMERAFVLAAADLEKLFVAIGEVERADGESSVVKAPDLESSLLIKSICNKDFQLLVRRVIG